MHSLDGQKTKFYRSISLFNAAGCSAYGEQGGRSSKPPTGRCTTRTASPRPPSGTVPARPSRLPTTRSSRRPPITRRRRILLGERPVRERFRFCFVFSFFSGTPASLSDDTPPRLAMSSTLVLCARMLPRGGLFVHTCLRSPCFAEVFAYLFGPGVFCTRGLSLVLAPSIGGRRIQYGTVVIRFK